MSIPSINVNQLAKVLVRHLVVPAKTILTICCLSSTALSLNCFPFCMVFHHVDCIHVLIDIDSCSNGSVYLYELLIHLSSNPYYICFMIS